VKQTLNKMQLVLSFAVVAAVLTQGDAADVRALLRQKLMASVGATCGDGSDSGPLQTMCSPPSQGFLYTIPGGCNSTYPVPIYVYNATSGLYTQYCRTSTCTFQDTVEADANVGGYSCTGNKNVAITVPGVMMKECTPCLDAKMNCQPEDKANLAACGMTNEAFGCAVDWTVNAANTVANTFTDLGNDIAKGTTKFFDNAGKSLDSTGKAISSTATDLGNDIANGATSTYNDAAKGASKAAKSTKKFFKGR
jgi:hypothetical protein